MTGNQQVLLNTRTMASTREMRRLKRERLVKDLGLKPGQLARLGDPDFAETEFNMPDESRTWSVRVGPCAACGFGPLQILVARVDDKTVFFVRCTNYGCDQKTPEFGKSQLAIRHWKLVAALSK